MVPVGVAIGKVRTRHGTPAIVASVIDCWPLWLAASRADLSTRPACGSPGSISEPPAWVRIATVPDAGPPITRPGWASTRVTPWKSGGGAPGYGAMRLFIAPSTTLFARP